MTPERPTDGRRLRLWPRTFWMRVLLILVLLLIFFSFVLPLLFETSEESGGLGALGVAPASAAITYHYPGKPIRNAARITTRTSDAAIGATLSHPMTPAVANAILRLATVTESVQLGSLFALPTRCHGRVWKVASVKIRLIHFRVAWRRTAVNRWCWNSRTIIGSEGSGDDGKDAILAYCWVNETHANLAWNASGSERRVNNQGTLKVCSRVSLQRTVNPRIWFRVGGKAHG